MKANKAIIIGIIAALFLAIAGCAHKAQQLPEAPAEVPAEQTASPQPALPEASPGEEPSPAPSVEEEPAPVPLPAELPAPPPPPPEAPAPAPAPPLEEVTVSSTGQLKPTGLFFVQSLHPGRTSAQAPVKVNAQTPASPPEPTDQTSAQVPPAEEHGVSQQNGFEAIDQALKRMEQANIAFNAPASMMLNETAIIQLVLGFEKEIEELKQMIGGDGEKEGARIRVSCRMKASLSGTNFDINKITPELQLLSKCEVTSWMWEVKPKSEGRQNLHLTLTAFIDADGKSSPRAIRTFDKVIAVEAVKPTWGDRVWVFIGDNWQWLWATLLVPAVGWFWKRMKGGKTKGG